MSSTYPPFGGASAQTCLRCGRQLPPNGSYCEGCGYDNPSPQRGSSAGRRPSATSTLSWDGRGPSTPSYQEQGRSQGGVQWGQLPVPPLQIGFADQQSMPPNSAVPMPSPPPMSPLPNKFAGQRPFTSVPNSFGDLPPLRPPDDQFPPLPSRQNGLQGLPPLPQGQNSFVGQPVFPQQSGINDFSGSSGPSMSSIQPLNGSGRLLNTGNLYGPGPAVSPPQPLNPAAMPANLRTGMAYEPQAAPLPQKKRSGPGPGMVIGIGLLIIVLIGGGITAYMLLGPGNTAQTANTPSPATKDTPIFTDAFTNNNNGWNLQGDPGKFSASVGNGTMVLEDDNHSLLWELVPGQKTFSNFKLMVDAVLSKGDQNNGYGVFIRGASNQNSELATYYRFALYGDGSYAIFKGSVDANGNTTNTRLQDYALDPAIKKSGLNHIIIVANGPAMTFIVNGQPLKTVTDNSYTSGSVALFVINLNPSKTGGQATFSNFGIYQLKP